MREYSSVAFISVKERIPQVTGREMKGKRPRGGEIFSSRVTTVSRGTSVSLLFRLRVVCCECKER